MRVAGIPYVQGCNSYADPDGRKFGIAIHNTSNNASAEAEASYATRRPDGVSSHFYCDGDSVIQSLDTSARAGHAGSSTGNNNAVAVEITGVNGWTRQQWLDRVAWDLLGRVLAQVCQTYGIARRRASVAEMKSNPQVKAFYSHDDMRLAWGGTTHTDPGPNFPWDRLFAAVSSALGGDQPPLNSEGDTMTTLDSPHEPPWNEPPNGDGEARSIARLIWETWDTTHTRYADTAARFPNSVPAAIKRLENKIDAIPAGGGTGGVTHAELVDALKEALTDPAVAAVLTKAAFDGSQQAEQE